MAGILAAYVSTTTFTVTGDQTAEFNEGRRVRATCTGGYKYGTVSSSSYSSSTTVILTATSDDLNSGLSKVFYGIQSDAIGSIPIHKHDTTEGEGGVISFAADLTTLSGVLQTNIDGKADTVHTHDDRYYTETEVDVLIATVSGVTEHDELNNLDYASAGHTGFQPSGDYLTDAEFTTYSGTLQTQIDGKSDTGHTHDDRYYTESEVDTISGSLNTKIDGKADTVHTHDDRYYTETEIDGIITTISGKLDDHDELNNLDYASAGHTGFQPAGDYVTDTEMTTISGNIVSQIPTTAAEIIYDGDETVEHILDDTINAGILHAITVTDEGGINISWTSGKIWNPITDAAVTTDAQVSTACTDNTINYLYWDRSGGGTALTLSITPPNISDGDTRVAAIYVQHADIWEIGTRTTICCREIEMSDMLSGVFSSIVESGLVVSEHAGDGAFDVDMTAGVWWHNGHDKHTVSAIDSTVSGTGITRWYHDGSGNWIDDTSSQINAAQYDTGTALASTVANKYYRSCFFLVNSDLHWVYPTVGYATVAQAIAGPNVVLPTAFRNMPRSTALVLKGDAVALPAAGTDRWIDVRPILGAAGSGGTISDHGDLAGLDGDDHLQYLLTTDATSRANFVTKWGDLTDNGDTTIHIHDTRYYTESEVDTISGSLNDKIDAKDNYTSWSFAVDGVTKDAVTSADILNFVSGDNITITRSADDEITISGSGGGGSGGRTQDLGGDTVSSGTNSVTISFAEAEDDTDYFILSTLVNTTDATPSIYNYIITDTTVNGFTATFGGDMDSANYELHWSIVR